MIVMGMLEVKDLHVKIDDKEILKGVNLTLEPGRVHALMGPNGSGKSTLAHVLMGHPRYAVTKGKISLNGEDITELPPDERAKKGLFLSFQYPSEIAGITITSFLRSAINAKRDEPIPIPEFKKQLDDRTAELEIDPSFMKRYLNKGFSGGEKKRAEILQLLMLDPKVAILDETDSGLDIDALKIVAKGVNAYLKDDRCILIITHYKRILEFIKPDKLSIIIDGKVALEGAGDLVDQLEEKGYGWIAEDQ
jgi:Fe-S cluster assembly ATP-binding protein